MGKSEHFEDDLFVSYKLAPTIQHREPLENIGASFIVNPGQKPGSFEAHDVQLEGDNRAVILNGSAFGVKGSAYGPAKGGWVGATASPYGKGCGKGCSGMKTEVAQEGMSYLGSQVTGSIKSFSSQSAWGFASADEFNDDCFFSLRTNPHLDQASIVKGARIQFTVQASQKREGALEAVDIMPTSGEMPEGEEAMF